MRGVSVLRQNREFTVAAISGLVLGICALLFSPIGTLGAVSLALLVLVAVRRPELALLGILAMTSTVIFEEDLPLLPIGVGSLHVADLVLLSCLSLVVLRAIAEPGFRIVRTPLDVPLLGFYVLTLMSTLLAVYRESALFVPAFRELRVVTYYLVFFAVTNLLREPRQIRLFVNGLLFMACAVGASMILQSAVGGRVRLLPGRVEELATLGTSYAGVTRVLPPGQALTLVGFITLTAILALEPHLPLKSLRFVVWVLIAAGLAVTFNRSYWTGAGLALIVLVLLGKGEDKVRLAGYGLSIAMLTSVVLLAAMALPLERPLKLMVASWDRLSTLANDDIADDPSLRSRYVEYEYAVPQVGSHLVVGLGLGARYRPFVRDVDWEQFDGRAYLHNGHLWLILKGGGLAYLFLAYVSFLVLCRGFRYWRRPKDARLGAAVIGFTLTYLAVMLASVTSPLLTEWFWTPLIGMMAGVNEVVIREAVIRDERKPTGLVRSGIPPVG